MRIHATSVILSFLTCAALNAAPVEVVPSSKNLAEKKQFTVTGEEAFRENEGFGGEAGQIRMMNLMMVEGSGLEGMDMRHDHGSTPPVEKSAPATFKYLVESKITPAKPRVGSHVFEFTLKDSDGGPAKKGLAIRAEVSMVTMDMGVETPPVTEPSPGHYRVAANFSMAGTWRIKLTAGTSSLAFIFEAE